MCNLGESHENGVVECANGSLKRRISQQLKLRQSNDVDKIEAYQTFIDRVVEKLNRRSHSRFIEEKQALQSLPKHQAVNYQALNLKVTRSSTIEVRRVVYSVPRIDSLNTTLTRSYPCMLRMTIVWAPLGNRLIIVRMELVRPKSTLKVLLPALENR
ncbi:hypothetical protein [Teredinibacter haidensis]|uniref:hypothetical protein n=1 Tax=Teredinibacter haidensis TaxID=2731755 RepID=UPI000ABBA9F2|nr:hypothetical protein [Teredinibacter haidensis]